MTLFRKVFQNQAQPATQDEMPDEDTLRAAFTDAAKSGEPLVLDPFEHSVAPAEKPSDYDGADDDAWATVAHIPHKTAGPEEVDEDQFPQEETAVENSVTALTQAEGDGTDTEERHLELPDSNLVADTDEDIAAFLNRTFDKDAKTLEDPAPADAENSEQAAETSAANADVEEQIDTPKPEHLIAEEQIELAEASGSPVPSAKEVEPEPTDTEAPELDLNEFAKTQLTNIAGDTASSAYPREEDTTPSMPEVSDLDLSGAVDLGSVPAPASGRSGRRAGRVKTRLLGFNQAAEETNDPFGQAPDNTATPQREKFPVGWLVVVEGPGVGHAFSIFTGASVIGRGEDQMIRLDFGDNTISRNNHAAIAYDEEVNKFYIGHGGKSNIIRRNARPVLSTEELNHADLLRIGETTLRFVALCGSDFQWNNSGSDHEADL